MKLQNDLFLRAITGEVVERPPVWLMRQAGRTLPNYRKIRASVPDFKTLVESPELIVEATVEPVEVLGVDAAIIFSDILVIPEAMGLPYELLEKRGPRFPRTIKTQADVRGLRTGVDAAAQLAHTYESVRLTKQRLQGRVPLIGFAGAPWTIMAYMVEGSGSKTFASAKEMLFKSPELAHQLLDKITQATIAYLKEKIIAGVDVIQLFDSWAGILSPHQYHQFAMPYLKEICDHIQEVPVTVFSKGAWFALKEIGALNCQAIGLDWNTTPQFARAQLGNEKVLQGNLDPCQLFDTLDNIEKATLSMLKEFGTKHIANLGHGVYPETPVEAIHCFVDTVKRFRY
ncbi:MAG: uroporphyrinogen decarboxylase [Saprospiraceae bacterium]|nr:uroporphyrinogen decarboxylase [Saprospiraceae bacterium]